MYQKEEVDAVLEDIEPILTRFKYDLNTAVEHIEKAEQNLQASEAVSFLRAAQGRLVGIDFAPIYDTLQGIIDDNVMTSIERLGEK